jgi:hypothetical protein
MSSLPNVPHVLPVIHIHASQHAGWCGPGWTSLSCSLQSLCKRHAYTLPRRRVYSHVPQIIAPRRLSRDISREILVMATGWRIGNNFSKSTVVVFAKTETRIQKPRPFQFFRDIVGRNSAGSWVCPWYTADKLGTCQPGRKKDSSKTGCAWPLLNGTGFSMRNSVLLYKQLIRPMMDYACPIWRSAVRSHFRKLECHNPKCLRVPTNAPRFVSDGQIQEDLWIPFYAEIIRALTESLDEMSADAGNSLV